MISEIDMDVNIWENLDELIHNLSETVSVKEDTYLISLNKVRKDYKGSAHQSTTAPWVEVLMMIMNLNLKSKFALR